MNYRHHPLHHPLHPGPAARHHRAHRPRGRRLTMTAPSSLQKYPTGGLGGGVKPPLPGQPIDAPRIKMPDRRLLVPT